MQYAWYLAKHRAKEIIRRIVLDLKIRTDVWFVTDEMHKALDDGDVKMARELLAQKEQEWPNGDPELVGFATAIFFYDDHSET